VAPIDAPAAECGVAGGGLAAGSGASHGGPVDETAQWLLRSAVRARSVSWRWRGCTACCCASLGAELGRRAGRHPVTGPELDDLAHQSADDALLAVTAKLGQFRGESRFTTWAYKFVVLEVSSKLGRHFWQRPAVVLDAADWDRLPDPFRDQPGGPCRVAGPGRRAAPGG